MHDVSKIEPEKWARYKAKCAEFAPNLARLKGIFEEIAAGRYDDQSAYTELCVDDQLESIRDELKDTLAEQSRYTDSML
jgi:hypothetical protein